MTSEQIAYWDRVILALVKTDEWKKDLEENFWEEGYVDAKTSRKRLDDEYAEYKAVLTELGLTK
jgi:tripartite-type tricarboxylate transporter receptor subunit TctC